MSREPRNWSEWNVLGLGCCGMAHPDHPRGPAYALLHSTYEQDGVEIPEVRCAVTGRLMATPRKERTR